MNLSLILSKFGISQGLSQDIMLVLVVIFVSFVFGTFIGRHKLITVLINIYISLALISAVPEGILKDYSHKLWAFFILLVLLTIFSKRLFEIYISGSGSGFLWRVFAMSFLEVAMLLSITLSLVPKKVGLEYVSASAYGYLASSNAIFFWLAIPLVFMFIIHKRISR